MTWITQFYNLLLRQVVFACSQGGEFKIDLLGSNIERMIDDRPANEELRDSDEHVVYALKDQYVCTRWGEKKRYACVRA